MDQLAEMHLLLREHGWEPEYFPPGQGGGELDFWAWRRIGCPVIETWMEGDRPVWRFLNSIRKPNTTADSLRRRLKELAAEK